MSDILNLISQFILPIAAGGVLTAVLFFARGSQESNLVPFAGLDASRSRVLRSLERLSPPFSQFYSLMRGPEELLKKNPRNPGLLFSVVTIIPWFVVFVAVIVTATLSRDLVTPLSTFVGEMEFLAFSIALLSPHPNNRIAIKFWENFNPDAPRRAWAILFFYFRMSYTLVGFFAFGSALSVGTVAAIAYFLEKGQAWANLVSGSTPYYFLALLFADLVAVLVFRAVYFGGIHRIENYAFSRYFEHKPLTMEVNLSGNGRERGIVSAIDKSLILKRDDGFEEDFRWQDIQRIATKEA